jgi:hypothetical protein
MNGLMRRKTGMTMSGQMMTIGEKTSLPDY